MHAILDMAASHLSCLTGEDLHAIGLHHRVLAIKGSNLALSRKIQTAAEGDAVLGCCYLLTFQSTYMTDGISEFFHFVRGCNVLSEQLQKQKMPMAFFLEDYDHYKLMAEKMQDLPVINPELLEGAVKSLAALPALFSRPSHEPFHELLVDCVQAVRSSSAEGRFLIPTPASIRSNGSTPRLFHIHQNLPNCPKALHTRLHRPSRPPKLRRSTPLRQLLRHPNDHDAYCGSRMGRKKTYDASEG